MEQTDQIKKFEELSENIQDGLLSPNTIKSIHDIGRSEGLFDGERVLLAQFVADVFTGSLKEAKLSKEIEVSFGVEQTTAQSLANKLISNIIIPIKTGSAPTPQIEENAALRPSFAKEDYVPPQIPPTPASPPPPTPPQNSPEQKAAETPTHEAPFILHTEEEIEPTKEAAQAQYNIQRPTFYKPTFSEEYKKNMLGSEAARVELGDEPTSHEPVAGKTKNQETRIVHYSEFRTPLDPFSGTQEQQTQTNPAEVKKSRETPEVHPNNVVDLKDLPLE